MGIVLVGLSSACADTVKEQKETNVERVSKVESEVKANNQASKHRPATSSQSTASAKTVSVPRQERLVQFRAPRIVQYDDEYPPVVEQIEERDWSTRTQKGSDHFFGELEAPPTPEIRAEENVFEVVDELAEFPGGMAAMREYLKKNMSYPAIAKDQGLQGKCYIRFIVNTDGSISDVKVLRGVPDCPQCDSEAVRVVKNMPKWAPGKVNGKAVRMNYNLPLVFKLT